MADLLRLFVFSILMTISLVAYFLVMGALFPQRIVKTKAVAQSMPARSLGIGLVNFVFFAVIALLLLAVAENAAPFLKGILSILALIIFVFLAIVLSFGLAGMSGLIGERIFPSASPWQRTLWGTVCLSLACTLPFVGWFLLLPYAGFVGIGALILGFFQREKT